MQFLRRPARAVTALLMAVYVLTGALHGLHDFDVANPSGKLIVSMNKDSSSSERGVAAEHHCHGCFSVSMPAPVTAVTGPTPAQDMLVLLDVSRRGLPPGIDPPLPKLLIRT